MTDQWQNCYDDGWQGNIVPEAFSHPAKFSRGLINRIYLHAKEMEWIHLGDYVLDPFAGVTLGGLDALGMGLNWIGIELESKFVSLGQQNIDLWNRQLKGWPNLGTARIVQGDSRKLNNIFRQVYYSHPLKNESYTQFMPVISTDQFKGRLHKCPICQKRFWSIWGHARKHWESHQEIDIERADLVVSSPPIFNSLGSEGGHQGIRSDIKKTGKNPDGNYGQSPGQLCSMKEGSFDLCVSSPPYEAKDDRRIAWGRGEKALDKDDEKRGHAMPNMFRGAYSTNPANLGNPQGKDMGDTFWSASREIVQGCYELLKLGGHAIWVTKNYVKAKKIVPFSDRWLSLCESVGFKLICRHQAMLVKEHGTQMGIHGDEKITTERKSFFRRLTESKGSPRIDWEDVICMVKI